MSLTRAVVSVAAIFLGLSAAVAQQPETAANNAAAAASSALTNPPVFQGLMVDAKGKTVGRLYPGGTTRTGGNSVVRQINGVWVLLAVLDLDPTTGFQLAILANNELVYLYQSADCTGQAYFLVNPSNRVATGMGDHCHSPPGNCALDLFRRDASAAAENQFYTSCGRNTLRN
jgi:hypothetical protein